MKEYINFIKIETLAQVFPYYYAFFAKFIKIFLDRLFLPFQ